MCLRHVTERASGNLEAGKADPTKPLKDLKAIFTGIHKADNPNIRTRDQLADKTYHKLFEVIFGIVVEEKRKYLVAAKGKRSGGAKSELKLELCANVIFALVEAGASKFKRNTVEALVAHVIDTIPTPDGDYFKPVAQDYLKSLVALLEQAPVAERLKSDIRTEITEFCLDGLELSIGSNDADAPESFNSFSHGSGRPSLVKSSSGIRSTPNRSGVVSRQNTEDSLLCQILFLALSSVGNVDFPTLERASTTMMRLLQCQTSNVGQLHQVAFSVINLVLLNCSEDHTSFCSSIGRGFLPLMCRWWPGKVGEMHDSVRDEMLITLYRVHLHLEAIAKEMEDEDLHTNLEELLDTMRTDYARRPDRLLLHLDDVELSDMSSGWTHVQPFRLNSFGLWPNNNRNAERNWATLLAISILEKLVGIKEQKKVNSDEMRNESADYPRKRQRVPLFSERLLDSLRSNEPGARLAGLQILPFILQGYDLPTSALRDLLELLVSYTSDKRSNIASWALLSIASCAYQSSASDSSIDWKLHWHTGTKSLTFAVTCRAAALLLHSLHAKCLVAYRDIEESVKAIITTADISGPPILCDSSIALMMHFLQVDISEAPGTSLAACQHVVRWLFGKWNPADRLFVARYGAHIQPFQFVALLRTSLSLSRLPPPSNSLSTGGPVVQAWQQHLISQDVLRYLLLLDKIPLSKNASSCQSCPAIAHSDDIVFRQDNTHFNSVRKLIFEFLSTKFAELVQTWRSFNAEGSPQVSSDTYRGSIDACMTGILLLPHSAESNMEQSHLLESDVKSLVEELFEFLRRSEARDFKGTQKFVDALLQALRPYLPQCNSTEFTRVADQNPQLLQLLSVAAGELKRRRLVSDSTTAVGEGDPMDIDDEFSKHEKQSSLAEDMKTPRRIMAFDMSISTFNIETTARLILVAAMSETLPICARVPSRFVDDFILMNKREILSCRGLIRDVLNSDLILDASDSHRLLECMGFILSSKDFNFSEITMCACLEVLMGLLPAWSIDEASSFGADAKICYDWLVSQLHNGTASTAVQLGIVKMLLKLLHFNQNYGVAPARSSPRTILLELLEKGSPTTKFFIGDNISDIFDLFTLKEHDKIFVDVLELLPSDPNGLEGIAFRLYVLAKLASRWSTLLRRCIYHLFETPGRIQESVHHATRCVSEIASALAVKDSKELFQLFAPQILYTWLESEIMDDIPFLIFGFASLRDLLEFAQEEAAALLMMRGQDTDLEHLAELLQTSDVQLLQKCFSKIMAYCIASDIGVPPSSDRNRKSGESRLKKRLGQERFLQCVNLHFAEIVSILFSVIDQEQQIEKYFAKDENLLYAAHNMENMKSLSSSELTLPPNQQPTFKAKYLTFEIKHLCARTEHEVETLYTPSLVTFIARNLLRTIHPALGSLHACSVLRKLRVLISLSGDTATQGYPLEMLLRSVRPFITDPECADDSMGILQYLLRRGTIYLTRSPSFVASITLSVLGSLRAFMQERKSSTTQESQHQATLSKAQKFHSWIRSLGSRFKALMASANEIRMIGNAEKGSTESTLLDQLLEDEKSGSALLSTPARKLALGMLCSEFECPSSFRSDIYGDDHSAVANAVVVWKSCRGNSVSKQYLSWAARILGRAFAATGHVHQELLQESTLSKMRALVSSSKSDLSSRACIVSLLQSLLLGDDQSAVGLAETALRNIVTRSEDQIAEVCRQNMPAPVYEVSSWNPYPVPPCEAAESAQGARVIEDQLSTDSILVPYWLRDLSIALADTVPDDPILCALSPVLESVPDFADQAFPFILHLVLSTDIQVQKVGRKQLSTAFANWFAKCKDVDKNNLKALVNAILYLRTQQLPHEKSSADRLHWLELDYLTTAAAAIHCGMFKTALMFVEEYRSAPVKSSRRSSTMRDGGEAPELPTDTLLTIFQNIDDPDLYYGVQQPASLSTILARLEYEKDGAKSLAFRGAQYDNHIRSRDAEAGKDARSLVKALDTLGLSGLSYSLLQAQQSVGAAATSLDSMFRTARRLEQWDIPVPSNSDSHGVTIYRTFQAAHDASSRGAHMKVLNEGLESTMKRFLRDDLSAGALHESLRTLAALSEMDEVLSSQGSEEFEETLVRFDDISQVLSCRGTTLSILSQQPRVRDILKLSSPDTRLVEVQVALMASSLNRAHGALQESLSLATSLIDLVEPCKSLGLDIEAAVHMEVADALWDQGETSASIGMLRALDKGSSWKAQAIPVGRPDLLSKIGHQVSVARLEKADRIIEKYLKPALKDLKEHKGNEAAQVFHQFAVFCDQQLQDQDTLEDLARLKKLSESRADEMAEYERLLKKATTAADKAKYKQYYGKAKTWLKLDEQEYHRHRASRDEFLRQCLENYLLALGASDTHDKNALRFTALWLEHSGEEFANEAVGKHLMKVASRKFASLMNQLSSRLLDNDSKFQELLFTLVLRISTDHPYHGMYQIYAGSHSRPNPKDEVAVSRSRANIKVAEQLKRIEHAQSIWSSMGVVIRVYVQLAHEKDEQKYKTGRKVSLRESPAGIKFNQVLAKYAIPPPTMHIDLAADKDYSKVPKMVKFDAQMTIASGVSLPKIITAVADNGARFRQLVKGGNDDLRQDAIMEQVFAQVSELLKTNRSTRQRNLSIRTYKVLPLTSTAGVIEFVPNTIPLHEYLMPAHERFYPKDLKGNQCRKEIGDVQTQSVENRVRKFKQVQERFHPVMRYFFTEHFTDPDEWFLKRLAYTRSTAAISILGHVLGLGDRHGHNILLDTESGEVVHIDLGVAFEMGRVLPVPELVPFRLTRDIVDGMGITKTEGVFRRCCEFTLAALRKEVYSIMTILDVLRYDPLYSWSISPVRLAKLQEAQSVAPEMGVGQDKEKEGNGKQTVNQPSEADRALTVVNKKLSKTLSVEATVADLINQASDERNLAVLYSGWAAYA
ncbi:Phosphatidylinositol 3 protein [Rutstroemia sp. NJR-2017a BVV2]|nr:Phosphatidylinositol 3 protein [Rutstroemia sp. NJR-2017a BVV2]